MAGKMKALQMWCKNNTIGYKDVSVVNMTTSWRDGLAFCALIHHFRPDLIDFNSLSKENVLHNNQLAFRTAEEELGIAALLDAEDMVAMKVPDKLSIITYVSQYYNCLHNMKPVEDKALKRSSSPSNVAEPVEAKRKSTSSATEPKVPVSPTPVLVEKKQVFSICEICMKKVHLVERYIDEGKIYHRQCHRTKSLSGMYQRNRSSPFHESKPDNTVKNRFKAPEKMIVHKPSVSPNSSPEKTAVATPYKPTISPNNSPKKTAKGSPKPPEKMIVDKPSVSPDSSPKKAAKEFPKPTSNILNVATPYKPTTSPNNSPKKTAKGSPKFPEKMIVDKPSVSPDSSPKKTANESPKPTSNMLNVATPYKSTTSPNNSPKKTAKGSPKFPEKMIVDKPSVSPDSSPKKTANESPKPTSNMLNVATPYKSTTSPNNSPKKTAKGSPKRTSKVLDMAMNYDKSAKFDSKETHSPTTNNKVVMSDSAQGAVNIAASAHHKNDDKSAKQDTVPTDITTNSHAVLPKPSQSLNKNKDTSELPEIPPQQYKPISEFADKMPDTRNTGSSMIKSEIGLEHKSVEEDKDTSKPILPSLLKSLADVKQKRGIASSELSSTDGKDDLQLSVCGSLINELPKPPEAKPRSRASSSNEPSTEKPKPRPRSNNSSFGSESNHVQLFGKTNISKGDSGSGLKPLVSPESAAKKTTPSLSGSTENKVNADAKDTYTNNSANLSGDKLPGKQNVVATTLEFSAAKKPPSETIGFAEGVRDVKIDKKQDNVTVKLEKDPKLQPKSVYKSKTGTINTLTADDARLNPFTDEYEEKKKTNDMPLPPARKKNQGASVKIQETKNVTNPASAQTSKSSKPFGSKSSVPIRPKLPNLSNSPHPSAKVAKKDPALTIDIKQNGSKVVAKQQDKEMIQSDNKQVKKTQDTAVRVQSPTPQNNTAVVKSPTQEVKSPVQKQFLKPSRPAPGFGFPLVKRRVKNQMTEDEIMNEMTILDIQLKDLEKKGVKLEEVLRDEMELGLELKSESDQLLGEWFDLVQEKNILVRRETDLVFLMQQQRLEQQHADVEFKIRKLLNKPDVNKTNQEKEEESKLLAQLMDIVERRNTIITSIEEARVKEEEEDAAYDRMKMMQTESHNDSEATKKKKKNKVKKIFSKRKKPPKSPKGELPTSPTT